MLQRDRKFTWRKRTFEVVKAVEKLIASHPVLSAPQKFPRLALENVLIKQQGY